MVKNRYTSNDENEGQGVDVVGGTTFSQRYGLVNTQRTSLAPIAQTSQPDDDLQPVDAPRQPAIYKPNLNGTAKGRTNSNESSEHNFY